ncbi:hypothetical protein [Plantibacter sp. YIM 135347]|uniref:hypothetical protein n=1 Tax=Plantibacter sp. YIM 135347 TaxID=3423919 RepID=UPI003D329F26
MRRVLVEAAVVGIALAIILVALQAPVRTVLVIAVGIASVRVLVGLARLRMAERRRSGSTRA